MPWAPRQVCAAPGCHRLTARGRCAGHARTSPRNHRGVPRQQRGHGADYERVRRTLLGLPCHWCGTPGDTADYLVPVSQGGTLADLVPACGPCNYARGAALARAATRVGGSETFSAASAKDRMAATISHGRVSPNRGMA